MKALKLWPLVLTALALGVAALHSANLADSFNDFSGVQGTRNWYYGYYDGDAPTPYTFADFELCPQFVGEWAVQQGVGGYWTSVKQQGGHPNSINTGGGRLPALHWSVRRWISTYSGDVRISGDYARPGGGGDGVRIAIVRADTNTSSQTILFQTNVLSATVVTYSITNHLEPGIILDFLIDPLSNDSFDDTRFTALISPLAFSDGPLTGMDVGTPTDPIVPGCTVSLNDSDYDVTAGGSDIWNNGDAFHFSYQLRNGDFDAKVRVASLANSGNFAKAAIMARETLANVSREIFVGVTPAAGGNFYEANHRDSTGGTTVAWATQSAGVPYPNAWIRFTRVGNLFTSYRSTNGVNWTQLGQITKVMPCQVYLGLATCANINTTGRTTTAEYRGYQVLSNFPPRISTQPVGGSRLVGTSFTFIVGDCSGAPVTYQWRRNGSDLSGATNSSLTLSNLIVAQSGSYVAVLNNGFGAVTSSVVTLTVTCPTITVGPATLPGATNGVSFSRVITVSGGTAPHAFTISSGTLPGGLSLSSTGLLSGVPTTSGPHTFTITATDANNCSGSRSYSLTVACPTITVEPAALPAATNGVAFSTTFTANGGAAPHAFSLSSGALPGGLTLSFGGLLSGVPTAPGPHTFTVTATDANNCSGSRAYSLDVLVPPAIVTPPTNYVIAPGSSVTFSVSVSGTPPLSYQWQLNGTNIPGATSASYTLPMASAGDVGLYTVTVCNAVGCATSTMGGVLSLLALDLHPVLHLFGPIGAAYRIDYSEDIAAPTNWSVLTNITVPTSPYLVTDPTPARQVRRFYRAIPQ